MGDTNKKTKKILSILLVVFIVFALGFLAWSSKDTIKKFFGFATVYDSVANRAIDNGWTTDSGSYAWGENIGWVDFAPSNGNVYVADNALWGYVYGENIGWISLNCANEDGACSSSNFKVANDGSGNLSGYAYGENIGWINFGSATSTYHVVIDATGNFTGYAWGENVGWISFNSANGGDITYKVSTNWRHQSDRPECNNGIDDDNDDKIDYPADTSCNSKTDATEKGEARRSVDTEEIDVINVLKPIQGAQWTTGITYKVSWIPVSTSTDTYIYIIGGGYEDGHKRLVAYSSSTDTSMDYYVTDEDLPKLLTAGYQIAICVGSVDKIDPKICGLSGVFYIDSAGKKVDPKPVTSSSSSSTNNGGNEAVALPPIKTVELPVIKLEPLVKLPDLPSFTSDNTKDSFTFIPPIKSFLFAPLPDDISKALDKFPKLKDYLASVGFSKEQDLISLNFNPISLQPLPEPVPAGLFVITNGENIVRTHLASDPTYKFAQLARVASGTPISISLMTKEKVTGEWGGEKIPFVSKDGKATLQFVSDTPGRYVLTTAASPLPLAIEVLEKPKTKGPITGSNSGNWLSRLFGR